MLSQSRGMARSRARRHASDPDCSTPSEAVERLAEEAHLSVRQFSRAFVEATGMTPAKAIERLRAEAARPRVEDGREPLEVIGRAVGFADPERMRQSFIRVFGHSPQAMRRAARNDGTTHLGSEAGPYSMPPA